MELLPWGSSSFWTLFSLGCIYFVSRLARFGAREKHLPPGPPTYPIVGNAHLAIDKDFYKRFKDWSEQYGHVFSLKIGKGTMVVLNSKRAVYELIDKRSAIYSSRPLDEQFHITFKDQVIASMDADPIWRTQRKIVTRHFAPARLDGDLARVSEAEVTILMHDLLIDPGNFYKHVDRAIASASSIALFGQCAKSSEDLWATGGFEAMEAVNAAISHGTYLPTEQFPIFKWIPKQWLASTKRAEEGFRIPTQIWAKAREHIETRRNLGDKRDSLMDDLLDDESIRSDPAFQGSRLANFVGAVMQAAAETPSFTMRTNIMFLATHPWVQDKAQLEIDALCGVNRVPTFNDSKKLPYINCIMKEGLRIRPVVPTGIPHRCTEDNWYEGMLIPKDATIMIPHWALGHTHYSNPSTYDPDRYLNHPALATEYASSSDYENRDHYTYGAGRRICAGIHFAERIQWRILARLLWAFRIEHAVDANGERIEIDTEAYEEKLITGPKPFRVRFTPRSEEHVKVIERELEAAKKLLKKWE